MEARASNTIAFPSRTDWVKWTIYPILRQAFSTLMGKTALNRVENRHNARSCPHF
ncbi:hypothetical protein KsCSTR_33500 [Candidatus Kuenenia stuttgartiensis]|uniref:Uncharacterized protein n=1 Tax=Kuenenia stuttgartiensis TaxID=174633 RepID=Q1Q4E6_KUEST|nr:hypothetical protein KsCSTR_33500 [Candidatus Kuenenia stuttgartiensis]CAJ74887.1 unknown protein [Candidatus Kuenenia stuttgartiensis]